MNVTDEMNEQSGPKVRAWSRRLRVVAIVLAALLGVAAAFALLRPHTYAGSVLQAPIRAESLDGLVMSDGRDASLEAFAGKVVLVYFGYTHCPDICPTTLARAAQARELMGDDADGLQVLMISVDPERDTVETLSEYMAFFDPTFLGVTGPVDTLDKVATLYGVYVRRNEGTVESGYTVDHTGTLMAIDPDGYLRIVYPNDVDASALAADMRELLHS